jgi:hypothetical protein
VGRRCRTEPEELDDPWRLFSGAEVSNVNTFDTQIPEHGEYIGELE